MSTSPWFPFQTTRSAPRRLFCFPYAGGNPQFFQAWQQQLPDDIEVWPVQLPGRGIRYTEESFTELDALIDALSEAIHPYLDRPFFLFGHSMGALVSFELARYMQQQWNIEPDHLFVSGFHAPHLPDPNPPIYHLPDDEFLNEVIAMNGMPQELLTNREWLEAFLPFLRADFTLCERYRYREGRPLTCPLTAFGGEKDPEAQREHLEPWAEQTTGPFQLHILPGDHFFIHHQEAALLRTIAQILRSP